MDLSALGLPELTGFAAALAAFTVSIIDFLKRVITKNIKGAWTAKVPDAVWYVLAIAIPTAVCVPLGLDWFQSLAGEQLPENLAPFSSAATGVLVGIGASGSYKAKELGKSVIASKGVAVKPTPKPNGPENPDYVAPAEVLTTPEPIITPDNNTDDSASRLAEESTNPEQPPPVVKVKEQPITCARPLRFAKPTEAADLMLIDGDEPALYPVEYALTGPSERSPNHVVILKGRWRS